MLYVPRHLPNKLEYKVLSCMSVHYQSRMTSNGIAITPSHPPTVQAGQYEVGWVMLLLGDPRSMRLGIQDVYAPMRILWMSLVGEPYAACSGGVVGLSLMTWTTLMIRPQAPKCSRPFQLNLLFWGIVPCVSKIDTLGLFHSLL